MKKIILLSLLFTTQLQANTVAYFADGCSGEEIKISTPNGTTLRVELLGLDAFSPVNLYIKFRPAGEIADLKDNIHTVTHSYVIHPEKIKGDTYRALFKLPKTRWMQSIERRNNFSNIWDAEIRWAQPLANKTGSAITSFLRSEGKKAFFQVTSPGLCQWEEEAEISSKLYENNSTGFMNVARETVHTWDRYSNSGFSLGPNRNTGGAMPIGSLTSDSNGWFFKDWEKQVNSRDSIRIERKYVLNKEEAGLFIHRLSYNRHEVTRYEWVQETRTCGRFEAVSTGLLDVGMTSEDFIVLPRHIYPREEEMKRFINVIRPPVNNCQDSIDLRPQFATDYIPSSHNGILYFYETDRRNQ